MKQIMRDMINFHAAIQHPIGNRPKFPDDTALNELRIALIVEEIGETLDAIRNRDLAALADGIADSIVVLVGTAVVCGIDMVPIWNEVMRTNFAKAGGPLREDGKRLKPEGWTPPDIHALLIEQGAYPSYSCIVNPEPT